METQALLTIVLQVFTLTSIVLGIIGFFISSARRKTEEAANRAVNQHILNQLTKTTEGHAQDIRELNKMASGLNSTIKDHDRRIGNLENRL